MVDLGRRDNNQGEKQGRFVLGSMVKQLTSKEFWSVIAEMFKDNSLKNKRGKKAWSVLDTKKIQQERK